MENSWLQVIRLGTVSPNQVKNMSMFASEISFQDGQHKKQIESMENPTGFWSLKIHLDR